MWVKVSGVRRFGPGFQSGGWRAALCELRVPGRERVGIVTQQRVHAVTLLIAGNRGGIDSSFQIVATTGDPSIRGVRSRPPAPSLLKGVLLAHGAIHLQIPQLW